MPITYTKFPFGFLIATLISGIAIGGIARAMNVNPDIALFGVAIAFVLTLNLVAYFSHKES